MGTNQHSNWGNYPQVKGVLHRWPTGELPGGAWIARGLGRSYGDASLGAHMLSSLSNNRFLEFDVTKGVIRCQAGVSYAELLQVAVPRGWFPPVTPGTKFVTMGGAVAADVHGKNHHGQGSLGDHVLSLNLRTANGEAVLCSREQHPTLFAATIGGMGLTGAIEDVTLQLKPVETSMIRQRSIKAQNLNTLLELFEQHHNTTYSVAWIDCLAGGANMGRSILMLGEHAQPSDLQGPLQRKPLTLPKKSEKTVPFFFPSFALNGLSARLFNALYYRKQWGTDISSIIDYDTYFYPLDSIHHWNRIYGRRGFVQYQLVVPREAGTEAITDIIRRISDNGQGSFLAVLKTMGPHTSPGKISFPIEGYTLALDFPLTRNLLPFLHTLDRVVASYGGRVYLAKDARMSAQTLLQTYPTLGEFQSVLESVDPQHKIQSAQSLRLKIRGT